MSSRLVLCLFTLLVGAGVAAFFLVPFGAVEVLDKAHAAVGALQTQPGDPDGLVDRINAREFDLASHARQAAGSAAYNKPPSGTMSRIVQLPSGTKDGAAMAKQVCAYLEKNGFTEQIESKFPLVARTDSHAFKLQPMTTPNAGNAVGFSFEYTGFIRQGEPREIADYAESLVRKEVNARCWNDAGFVANPPRVADVSETAIITDLPDEPDTAAAQAKLFKNQVPAALQTKAPVVAAAPPPRPSTAGSVVPATAYIPHAPSGSKGPAGSDLVIKKNLKDQPGYVIVNAMDYATLDDTTVSDTDLGKLLDQGQKNDPDAAKRSPLDQPAKHMPANQEMEHPQ